ncbi:MAG: hypothetical protein U0Y68_20650 [Blastocatellia bacterium]
MEGVVARQRFNTGTPPVIYNGTPYYCSGGSWAAGSGLAAAARRGQVSPN